MSEDSKPRARAEELRRCAALSDAQYDLERAKVSDADGLRELFRRCGWPQNRIAAKEKRSQAWVSRVISGKVRPGRRGRRPAQSRQQLPQIHNLQIMHNNSKPRRSVLIDKVLTACCKKNMKYTTHTNSSINNAIH
jgi:hypothetical protein